MEETEKRAKLRVGLIIVVVAIVTGVVLFIAQGNGILRSKTIISADFATITGLRVGSKVQLAGVDIGSVSAIDFVRVQYQCDPLSEDIGRYGDGRTDNCDDYLFCSPLGLCGELEPYAAGEHARCFTTEDCATDEVCVTGDFRKRVGRVEWRGPTGVCARYHIQHWRSRVQMRVFEDELPAIRNDSRAEIAANSVLGGQHVTIDIGRGDPLTGEQRIQAAASVYEDIERFRRRVDSFTEKADTALIAIQGVIAGLKDERTINAIKGTFVNLEVITQKLAEGQGLLGGLINSPEYNRDMRQIVGALRGTSAGLSQAADSANGILETVDENMNPVFADARIAFEGIGRLFRDLRDPANKSLGSTLLVDRKGVLLGHTTQIANNASRITGSVAHVAVALEQSHGTLGKLINDPTVIEDVGLLLRNIASHGVIKALTIVLLRRYDIDVKAARDSARPKKR